MQSDFRNNACQFWSLSFLLFTNIENGNVHNIHVQPDRQKGKKTIWPDYIIRYVLKKTPGNRWKEENYSYLLEFFSFEDASAALSWVQGISPYDMLLHL